MGFQTWGSEEGDASACADDDHPGAAVVENIPVGQRRSGAVDASVVHGCEFTFKSLTIRKSRFTLDPSEATAFLLATSTRALRPRALRNYTDRVGPTSKLTQTRAPPLPAVSRQAEIFPRVY